MFKSFVLPLCLLSAATVALAADPVTDAMQKTYAPYRVALFKTNNNAQEDSRQAVIQAQQGWTRIVSEFGSNPPAPYAGDPAFAISIAAVNNVYAKALEQIAQNQLVEAHETLEEVRDILADMRRRNQVVVFSDHMNAYHLEMERALIDGPKWLQQDGHTLRLVAQAGVLGYLVARLREQAPASLKADADFERALAAVEASVNQLREAAQSQDLARTKAALGQVKAPYSRLFLRFG